MLQGQLTLTYADGSEEVVNSGDLFYWQPGHTVKVGKDAEVIMFSPQDEHSKVFAAPINLDVRRERYKKEKGHAKQSN